MKKAISALTAVLCLISFCCCNSSKPIGTITDTETETETETVPDSSTAVSETETEPEAVQMQIIPDLSFMSGMKLITQKDHKHGDRYQTFGNHGFYGEEVTAPLWKLAQWDSGPDLSECIIESDDKTITDGRWRTFAYDPDENMMTFSLDTSAYYNGNPSVEGNYWPHLLIEQSDFGYAKLGASQKKFLRCSSENLILSMDIRLGDYEKTRIDGDWVRAAQFLLYFYVKGTSTNDFCWFGVQLFDSRWDHHGNETGYDGGKPDASSAMIYSIGTSHVYPDKNLWKDDIPVPNGEWVHIEIDLKPYLEEMFERGSEDRYFKAKSLDDLCINGMNIGWETIGTFKHTMYVKNLSLISFPAGMPNDK